MSNQSLPLKHWGLERWPFRSTPGASQFYPTAGHNEALARIEYLVDGRRRLGALLGEAAWESRSCCGWRRRSSRSKGRAVVLVDALGASTREFLWQVACGLGTSPREDADVPWLWRQIADRVAENRVQQVDTVLLVDDAGQAGPDLVTQFVRLARLDVTPAARWTIVLAAEPAQAARWNEALRNWSICGSMLLPWTAEDTIGYVQTALVEAGRFEPLFDDDALQRCTNFRRRAAAGDAAGRLRAVGRRGGGIETIDAAIVRSGERGRSLGRRLRRRRIRRSDRVGSRLCCNGCRRSVMLLQITDAFAQRSSTCFSSASRSMRTRSRIFVARRLDRLGRLADFVEVAGPFFDFQDRFVDRFEIDLLSGRLPFGAEAEGAGGDDAGFRNTSVDGSSASHTTMKSLP